MSKQVQKNYQQVDQLNKDIHALFKQNELGAKILEMWKDFLIREPSHSLGKDLYSLGLIEGRKEHIRDIINAIAMAEGPKHE